MVPSWLLDLLGVLLLVAGAVAFGLLAGPLVAAGAGLLLGGAGALVLSWRYGRDGGGGS